MQATDRLMGNPLEKLGISDDELAEAIARDADVNARLNEFMTGEVVPYWKSVSPVRTGKYAASVKVLKKAKGGKGRVGATDFKAHWIEFGTGAPGPTQAAAPGQKTAEHFGGALSEGVDMGEQ